jgi:hypothetical protein
MVCGFGYDSTLNWANVNSQTTTLNYRVAKRQRKGNWRRKGIYIIQRSYIVGSRRG